MRVVIAHNAVPDDAPADERDVLVQVEAVCAALRLLGHTSTVIPCTLDLESLRRQFSEVRPDVVFNLVESLGGSDRLMHLLPALLDSLYIPYTGASAEAMLLSSQKLLAKQRLSDARLPTPEWIAPTADAAATIAETPVPQSDLRTSGFDTQTGRYIIKTVFEHGSFGMEDDLAVVRDCPARIQQRLAEAQVRLGRLCFAERFVEGREFNLSLLANRGNPAPDAQGSCARVAEATRAAVEVLPPAEIDFSHFPPHKPRVVGYRAKWDAASFEYHHTPRCFEFPATDAALLDQLRKLAQQCWALFGLRGYARVDFRVDAAGQAWVLEVNCNPCLSPDAGFAAAVQRAGLAYHQAIERILADALAQAQPAGTPLAQQVAVLRPLRHSATTSDVPSVRRLAESTGFFAPHEIDVAVELIAERLAKGDPSGYHFVFADGDEQLAGYACYGPIACTAASYDLYWIAVDPRYQRQGLGRRLLAEVESLVRHAAGQRIYIETSNRAQYASTRLFYQHCGYELQASLPDFYAPGDDKVVFVKRLA